MTTYKRICIEDWSIEARNGDRVELKRGEEYITSDQHEDDGTVTVFTNFWVRTPLSIWAGKRKFS